MKKPRIKSPEHAFAFNWLHRQPKDVQKTIDFHLHRPLSAGVHVKFLRELVSLDANIKTGRQYEALINLWGQLPTKLPFRLALAQDLDAALATVLHMVAEFGLGRHGVKQSEQHGGPKRFYPSAVREFESIFDVDSDYSAVFSHLDKCQQRHEAIERKTIFGEALPTDIWEWYCTQPVDVQEYLRRVACFEEDDLLYNDDEFWMHGRHSGLHAWLQNCAKEGRDWSSGIEMHTAFIKEAPQQAGFQ